MCPRKRIQNISEKSSITNVQYIILCVNAKSFTFVDSIRRRRTNYVNK